MWFQSRRERFLQLFNNYLPLQLVLKERKFFSYLERPLGVGMLGFGEGSLSS
jgi:hypothetical protein